MPRMAATRKLSAQDRLKRKIKRQVAIKLAVVKQRSEAA